MNDFFCERRPHNGLTYDAYVEQWQEKIRRPMEGLDKGARKRIFYARYNLERSEQVFERYTPSVALREAVEGIEEPQLWMVLTEDWCGDSAYNLPVIVMASWLNDHVTLRILRRDDNLDIMDQYLTGSSRSIPKLVAFAEEGTERFRWGPRPEAAVQLREDLAAQGLEKRDVSKALLEWYAEGGYEYVDRELAEAVVGVTV